MNLLRAASTVSLFTLASRITGLVREQLVAASFGSSAWTDAFNVAFRIPNLLRRLFAEGAFSQAFVPVLAASRARNGDDATRALIDAVAVSKPQAIEQRPAGHSREPEPHHPSLVLLGDHAHAAQERALTPAQGSRSARRLS